MSAAACERLRRGSLPLKIADTQEDLCSYAAHSSEPKRSKRHAHAASNHAACQNRRLRKHVHTAALLLERRLLERRSRSSKQLQTTLTSNPLLPQGSTCVRPAQCATHRTVQTQQRPPETLRLLPRNQQIAHTQKAYAGKAVLLLSWSHVQHACRLSTRRMELRTSGLRCHLSPW